MIENRFFHLSKIIVERGSRIRHYRERRRRAHAHLNGFGCLDNSDHVQDLNIRYSIQTGSLSLRSFWSVVNGKIRFDAHA